jgi:hypothetical protein
MKKSELVQLIKEVIEEVKETKIVPFNQVKVGDPVVDYGDENPGVVKDKGIYPNDWERLKKYDETGAVQSMIDEDAVETGELLVAVKLYKPEGFEKINYLVYTYGFDGAYVEK